MEKEFVGYNEALALKELGFNEPCFGAWVNNELFITENENPKIQSLSINQCTAPLYQQVFRWFREKYGCHIEIYYNLPRNQWEWCIHKLPEYDQIEDETCSFYDSYEEAELECLKKLISIVKNK